MMRIIIGGIIATLAAVALFPIVAKIGRWLMGMWKLLWQDLPPEDADSEDGDGK